MAKKTHLQFKPPVSAEVQFMRALRRVARASAHIVETHVEGHEIRDVNRMRESLEEYAKLLGPWAQRQSDKMLSQVSRMNKRGFTLNSKKIGAAIKLQVAEAPIGRTISQMMREQVDLIKSIPLEAGKRAQDLALSNVYAGKRADEIAEELRKTQDVTESRAMLIARTETARANAKITRARAEAIGSSQYMWHTSGDGAVRPSHRKMNGKIFSWNDPPTLEDGTTGNAGEFVNCRCYSSPIFDD